jgi:hypothetical protein
MLATGGHDMNDRLRVYCLALTLTTSACAWAQTSGPASPGRTSPAPAVPLDATQSAHVRQVIEAQLDAFAADDGVAAFSFASPGIRRQFGSPDHFLAMVRQAYPAVYRPASVSFLAPREAAGAIYQPVRLVDGESRPWVALYRMQRQADGTWRIDGCELIAQAGTTT